MPVAMEDSIQRYPLLRLLFCYTCGIGLADICYSHTDMHTWWCAWGILIVLFILLIFTWQHRTRFGMVASALFVMLGMCSYAGARSKTEHPWPDDKKIYEARVISDPRVQQRSIGCKVEITAVYDSSAWRKMERQVMVYMEPSHEASDLLPGDILCFKGRIQPPQNFSDSLTFDYARYITMQGNAGTVYLPQGQWHEVLADKLTLRERMLRLRSRLLHTHLTPAFEGDALGVLAALTLGDKRALTPELRATYSNVGVAHVLALSGMHIGIIYGMLTLVLRGLFRRRNLRWLRELFTIAVLWSFALLVGMPASVVRAVTMCTLYIIARWVSDGASSPLHVLSLTALLMLLVHPLYLFDVGFQLSFVAMAAILWVEPHLEMLFRRHNLHPIPGYFIGVLCMSLAAQLGTFPLVLHHFGTFPTYFLITNLIIVPLLSVILLLMVLWWALLLMGISWAHPLGTLLQHLVGWTNSILEYMGTWPGAVLQIRDYGTCAVLFSYLTILFTGLLVLKKWKRGALLALASLLALLLSLLLNL